MPRKTMFLIIAKWTGVVVCMGALAMTVSLLGVMGEYGTLGYSTITNLLIAASPLIIAVPPTVVLFKLDRRRRSTKPGHCQTCGYNLTGNESGVCPECAMPVPKRDCRPEGRFRNKA